MPRTSTRTPSAAQIAAARALLAQAGDPAVLASERRRELAAQQEAAQTVITPDLVASLLDITGGVRQSSKTPEPGKTAWVGASLDRVPVETPDGATYTVKVVITQKTAPTV